MSITCNSISVGVAKKAKRGKKRKISEVDNSVTEVPVVQTTVQTPAGSELIIFCQ